MNTEAERGNAEKTESTRGGDESHKTVMYGTPGSGEKLPGSPSASVLLDDDGKPIFWQPRADQCQMGCLKHCHGYPPCHGDCYFLRNPTTSRGNDDR